MSAVAPSLLAVQRRRPLDTPRLGLAADRKQASGKTGESLLSAFESKSSASFSLSRLLLMLCPEPTQIYRYMASRPDKPVRGWTLSEDFRVTLGVASAYLPAPYVGLHEGAHVADSPATRGLQSRFHVGQIHERT